MRDIFSEYIQIGRPGRRPIIKTRIKLTSGQILRLQAFNEEERQVGPKIPSSSNTAFKCKINYRPKNKVKK